MDLIGQLAGAIGVDAGKAEGIAGSVLGVIGQHAPEGALSELLNKAPEAAGWIAKAGPLLKGAQGEGGGGVTDLLGSVGGLLGGMGGGAGGILQGAVALQAVSGVLEKLGVSPELAAKAIPMIVSFVQSKLGDDGFAALLEKVPFLSELAATSGGSGSGGGLGGLLGGLGGLLK